MAKYLHADVLTGGLTAFKSAATKLLVLKAYAAGDSYATVVGNKIAEGTVASSEITIADDGTGRKATLSGRNLTATGSVAAGAAVHVAVTDGSAKVLAVTSDSSGKAIATGDPITVPDVLVQAAQPT